MGVSTPFFVALVVSLNLHYLLWWLGCSRFLCFVEQEFAGEAKALKDVPSFIFAVLVVLEPACSCLLALPVIKKAATFVFMVREVDVLFVTSFPSVASAF